MAVKSILEIDVQDATFDQFRKKFTEYQSALANTKDKWADTLKNVRGTGQAVTAIVTALGAQTAVLAKIVEEERRAQRSSRETEKSWRSISTHAKSMAISVRDMTGSLLKWTALSTVFTGILGVGSLFGLDRLGESVSAGRRASLGLGTSYGERKSFGVNFSRLVDSDQFLSSVADARGDVTKRHGFYGAGLGERDLQGSTGDVAAALLTQLKRIADTSDPKLFAQVLAARGLTQFASADDLRRLRATSPQEFAQLQNQYRANQGSLGLPADIQEKWQNFTTQMTRAGNQIEATFVRGLTPLVPGLERLSAGVEKTVSAFLGSDTVKKWLEAAGDGLEKFAKYIGTPEFEKNVSAFVSGLGRLASGVGTIAKWFGRTKEDRDAETHEQGLSTPDDLRRERAEGRATPWSQFKDIFSTGQRRARHNPGNLRVPGSITGFQAFENDEDGLRAMARQLKLYQNRDKLDTVRGIVSKYAPPNENNTDAYVKAVSKAAGVGPDDKVDLNNPGTLARIMSAMTKQEDSKSNFTPGAIKVIIENKTGADTITSTTQMSGQN